MHNNKTICLNMIVKNEAHIIASTLENLCNYVQFDYWVIVDTGSTDDTKQIIRDFFEKKNIKGEMHETEWKNFGFNRSDALSKAFNKTDYLLVFDADDRIVGDFILPSASEFNKDGYHLKFGDNFSYIRLLLVNNRLHWKFMGVLHEYIICTNENYNCVLDNIGGNYHLVSGKSGARSNNPNKYRDDALILEKAYKDAVEMKDDIMVRYSFYCAQSYKDAGNAAKAIEWYKKRISHGGWNQEVFYSYITIGQLYTGMNNTEAAFYHWTLSFDADPERCEGIYYIIKYCREKGNFNVAYHYYKWVEKNKTSNLLHKLFVTEDIYKYLLDYEFTIIACYVGQHKHAISSFHTLFKFANENEKNAPNAPNALSIGLKENIVHNLQFYVDFIDCSIENLPLFYDYTTFVKNIYLQKGCVTTHVVDVTNKMIEKFTPLLTHYDATKILSLTTNLDKETDDVKHDIVLTITSCKRFDLFEKTINSFLNNCSDVGKITYFFCVDDNSSDEDREQMSKLYPFFNFYFKNAGEKGHRQSMNIIWNKLNELKPMFYLHLEDDWLFINKRSYVTDSISFLERFESDGIHQILFNKNYAEIINGFNLVGGKLVDEDNNIKLHIKDEPNLNGSNCAYWPHFSFRPSVIRTSAVLTLGNFDSPNTFFERDYADKYFHSAGYTSAYFNDVSSIHIGKLTSESRESKKNAYELNNEEQFSNSGSGNVNASTENYNTNHIPIRIINLERRQDRKTRTIQQLNDAGFQQGEYKFIVATDGSTLIPTVDMKILFDGNDFGDRKGVIGCAITHYNLWKQLLDSKDEYYVIMEDDFVLCPNFKKRFQVMLESGVFSMKDTIFLGYHMFSNNRKNNFHIYNDSSTTSTSDDKIVPLNKNLYVGGYFMYSINRNGARKMIEYIEKNGIKHGIDYLNKIIPNLENYECQPQLAFSEWNEGGKAIDSDIQNIYDKIDFITVPDAAPMPNTDFIFFKNVDYPGNDAFHKYASVPELMDCAKQDNTCIAFNTVGFFKYKIDVNNLVPSPYFRECDGIYIKKEYYEANKDKNSNHNPLSLSNDTITSTLDAIHDSRGTYCFIHSCSLRNNDILDEILGKIKKIQFDRIFIINIGIELNKVGKVYGENVDIIEYSDNISLFEIPTINILHSFCVRNPESKVLYLHTKGVSYKTVPEPVVDWRNMMLYFLINNDCIKLLDEYDIVGCNYLGNPYHPHFSGNFWWTRASYVSKLRPIRTTVKHDAEWWIFSENEFNPTFYELHNSKTDHYRKLYPLEKYKQNDIIKIKMLCNWCSSKDLCQAWSNMCESGYMWKNIEITSDDFDIDYWVIINKPCDNSYYDPKRTIVFQMEPWVNNESHLWGVKTWGEWAEPDENKFLAVRGRKTKCHNNAFWELELKLNEIINLKVENRTDVISSMCSSKYYDEGHIARIDFLKFLEQKGDVKLDIYSWDNQHNFKNYRGPRNHNVDKSKGYIPYKYYFMVENNYEENFITEKIWEPILCETLVFYYGCPNVCDYIDPEAFVQLDMHDFEKSYEIVKQAIEEDWWSKRIEAIRREKKKILDELAFFPVIENIILKRKVGNSSEDNHNHNTLIDLIDNNRTDKNTTHSYLDLYEKLLHDKKYKAKNVLEIGIGPYTNSNGGSIKLWHDYFVNANIYALDVLHMDDVWDGIKSNDRINLITSTDAYNEDFFNSYFLHENLKFDFLLDDGPHTIESMKQFIKLYTNIMTEDGILIIEDVREIEWIQELTQVVPEHLQKYVEVYDLRHVKQRYDDIVFVINKKK